MRRFRLLSFIVAMLTVSGLLWLNMQGRWKDSGDPHYFAYFGTWDYGWPSTAISHHALLLYWKEYKDNHQEFNFNAEYEKVARDPSSDLLRAIDHPRGTILVRKTHVILWESVLLDIFVFLAAPALALFACESLLRRRESRAHASRRSTAT